MLYPSESLISMLPTQYTVDSTMTTIKEICNYLGVENNNPPPSNKIEIIKKIGNCWGIEHDCIVYDKDGTPHQFKYKQQT